MSAAWDGPPAGRTALLKLGGDVIADGGRLRSLLDAVATLTRDHGWRFVIAHGGGPQASALMRRLGLTPMKVGGRRVTDAPTLEVVTQALAGHVSVAVLTAARAAGLRAVGLSGVSDGVVTATRRPPISVAGHDGPVDFGLVGRVDAIRTELLTHLWGGGFTPVLNPLGVAPEPAPGAAACQHFNINADTVASAVAAALRVDHLFLVTGVPGVLRDKDDPATRIATLTGAEARRAIAEGVVVGGMIPKIEEALRRLAEGVGAVHILGASPESLLGEAASPGSHGTALLP